MIHLEFPYIHHRTTHFVTDNLIHFSETSPKKLFRNGENGDNTP